MKRDPIGQVVRCHWHLREHRWSVSQKIPGVGWRVVRDLYGRQVLYTKVVMKEVAFVVSEAGWERARRTGVRNVHAYMEGELTFASTHETEAVVPCGVGVIYNPFKYDRPFFLTAEDKEPLLYAGFAAAGTDTGVVVPRWSVIRPEDIGFDSKTMEFAV